MRLARSLLALAIVCVFSWLGYAKSEHNFNERVFGYFFSHLRASGLAESQGSGDAPGLWPNLWMQTSGEYEAIVRQTYRAALQAVVARVCGLTLQFDETSELYSSPDPREQLASCGRTAQARQQQGQGKPLAFVLDLDETVLDNSIYQSRLVLTGTNHSDAAWEHWVRFGAEEVELLPGAKDFLDGLRQLGIEVVFISNRPEQYRQDTVRALVRLGVLEFDPGEDGLLLQDGSSGKDARRGKVEDRFQIIGAMGDNLGDFLDVFNAATLTVDGRIQLVRGSDRWGVDWFVLPNPVYGDWVRYVRDAPKRYLKSSDYAANRVHGTSPGLGP